MFVIRYNPLYYRLSAYLINRSSTQIPLINLIVLDAVNRIIFIKGIVDFIASNPKAYLIIHASIYFFAFYAVNIFIGVAFKDKLLTMTMFYSVYAFFFKGFSDINRFWISRTWDTLFGELFFRPFFLPYNAS